MEIGGFLKHYKGLSDLTKNAYRVTLGMLNRSIAGEEPTDEEVLTFLGQFKAASTIQRHKSAIKAYYEYQRRSWTFDRRQFMKSRRRIPEYISREEVVKLIAAAQDIHEKLFIKTLFITGIRVSELMSLERESLVRGGIQFVGKRGKERIVPIVDQAFYQELVDYFSRCKGKPFPLKYQDYWLMLRRLCVHAGVRIISPHKLRHSCAVDILKRGGSLPLVQGLLGHENVATTLIYAELMDEDVRKQLEELK